CQRPGFPLGVRVSLRLRSTCQYPPSRGGPAWGKALYVGDVLGRPRDLEPEPDAKAAGDFSLNAGRNIKSRSNLRENFHRRIIKKIRQSHRHPKAKLVVLVVTKPHQTADTEVNRQTAFRYFKQLEIVPQNIAVQIQTRIVVAVIVERSADGAIDGYHVIDPIFQ